MKVKALLNTTLFLLMASVPVIWAVEPESEKTDKLLSETAGLEIETNVGIASNYLSNGITMTNNRPSLYGTIRMTYHWVFVEATMNSLQPDFFKKFQAEWIPAVGITSSFGEADLYATYRLYRYTGGTLFDGSKDTVWNYDEVAIGGEWKGFYGEIAKPVKIDGWGAKEYWLQLGYHREVGPIHLDGYVFFTRYYDVHKSRFTHLKVQASYPLNNGVVPYIGFSLGGQEADNESIKNRLLLGIEYHF